VLAALQTTAGCSLDFDYLRGNGQSETAGDSGSQDALGVGVDATDGRDGTTATTDASGADSADDTTVAVVDDGGAPPEAEAEAGPDCNAGGPPGNLFQNWSFECGSTSPWSTLGGGGALSLSTKHVHTGQYSSLTSFRSKAYQGPLQAVPLTANTSYGVVAYVYVESDALDAAAPDAGPLTVNITADVSCLVDGATSSNYIQATSVPITTDTWNYISGSFVMPSCTVATASVYVEGPPAGVDMYVDDISLVH
jgi:hypothetical protein